MLVVSSTRIALSQFIYSCHALSKKKTTTIKRFCGDRGRRMSLGGGTAKMGGSNDDHASTSPVSPGDRKLPTLRVPSSMEQISFLKSEARMECHVSYKVHWFVLLSMACAKCCEQLRTWQQPPNYRTERKSVGRVGRTSSNGSERDDRVNAIC